MSSEGSSPSKGFSGSRSDIDYAGASFDPTFTADISNRMQVPKNIRVDRVGSHGDGNDSDEMNGNWNSRNGHRGKFNMQVPDRIIVTGQEQHVGTRALPRELQLDTAVMPPDPEFIRIQTPPRNITLLNNPPRSYSESGSTDGDDETLVVENNRARFAPEKIKNGSVVGYAGGDTSLVLRNSRGDTSFAVQGYGEAGESEIMIEIEHLREQLSRMNRRVLAVEEETMERKEREKYIVMVGMLYVAYQVTTWLFRSGNQR